MPKIIKKPQAVANLESALVRAVLAGGGLSRVELARELKLVPSTAGIYVDRLIEEGYLVESTRTTAGLGRPPVVIELNPKGGRFIGVDFDARQVLATSVDFAQQPLRELRRTIPARATTERVLTTIEECIVELAGTRRSDVRGIGLGVPGPTDPERGVSRYYHFIRDWRDVPVGPRIAEWFKLPVFVENNLRLMAMAELWCGHGRGLRNLVCLGVRSGIGTGVIVEGRLLHGASNLAGEIGRWTCPEHLTDADKPCTIEDVASLTALLNEYGRGKGNESPSVADLLADGDARPRVERAARVHAWIVHQLASLLDPQRVVIASPLVESETYFAALEQAALGYGGPELWSRVARSTLGAFAGARGAAALAFQHWKPHRTAARGTT
ncbi:MAG TPA: ROK family transcriptional regulator [Pirellulales bacterium]|jgi:predicted NBD/HSP70 family sugar kinase|nr:ROK family transcriptional regulator [Pirellulales bacterium]